MILRDVGGTKTTRLCMNKRWCTKLIEKQQYDRYTPLFRVILTLKKSNHLQLIVFVWYCMPIIEALPQQFTVDIALICKVFWNL
jgi:hypothetical protein